METVTPFYIIIIIETKSLKNTHFIPNVGAPKFFICDISYVFSPECLMAKPDFRVISHSYVN